MIFNKYYSYCGANLSSLIGTVQFPVGTIILAYIQSHIHQHKKYPFFAY